MRISTIGKFFTIGAVLILANGCSNDVELPTAYHREHLAKPTDVAVSLSADDSTTVLVSWQIASEANVAAFVVAFTDATGSVETRSVEDPASRNLSDDTLNTESGSVIQVQVRAADAANFLGPLSDPVNLTID